MARKVLTWVNQFKERFSEVLSKDRTIKCLLFIFVMVYGIAFSYFSLVKYYTFKATAWDLGVFSQSLYTTLNHNRFFYNNLELGSHFHVHFTPILALVLPIYAIHQSPVTLLVLQAFVVALGAIPLYFLASQELNNKLYGLTFSALYLLYPALHGMNLFDFHPEKFVPFFVFSAFFYFKNAKWKKYFVFLVLALATKEDVSLIAIAVGIYGILTNRKVLFQRKINRTILISVLTIFVGFAWLILGVVVIGYFLRLDGYGSLWSSGYSHTMKVYGDIGGSGGILGILNYAIRNPLVVINRLLYPPSDKFLYLAAIFFPLCMTSFLHIPSIILFLPTLLEYMLASNLSYFSIVYQYPALLIPTVFIASVNGVRKFTTGLERFSIKESAIRRLLYLMTISTLITLIALIPITFQYTPLIIDGESRSKNEIVSLVLQLDPNPRILTQNEYFSHFSNSLHAYAHWNTTEVEYILVDVSSFWYKYTGTAPAEFEVKHGELAPFVDRVSEYIKSGEFGLLAQKGSLLLYKKGYQDNPLIYTPYKASFDYRTLSIHNGLVVEDRTSLSKKVLLQRSDDSGTFWFGPYVGLPPGKYEVHYRLKIAQPTDKYILTIDVADASILTQTALYEGNFSRVDSWQEFTLSFELNSPTLDMEFRGIDASNAADIYLDHIVVIQTAYK